VHQDGIGPFGAKSVDGLLPTMNRTIVHNPEDSMGGVVGRLAHDLTNQAIHRSNAVFDFAATEDVLGDHSVGCECQAERRWPLAPTFGRSPSRYLHSGRFGMI
jgi:hypothetical protein